MMLAAKYLAIDFETADQGRDSACAIGLVRVADGRIVDRKHFLIKPPRHVNLYTYIHGITYEMTKDQPSFAELWPTLLEELQDADCFVAHNAGFDDAILKGCCRAADLSAPEKPFLCTVKLARKAWNLRPTKLPDVCRHLNFAHKHHDALSDAEACAQVILALQREGKHNLLKFARPKAKVIPRRPLQLATPPLPLDW